MSTNSPQPKMRPAPGAARRRPLAPPDASAVAFRPLADDGRPPLVATPARSDVDLVAWARAHRDEIVSRLDRTGAILFRDFGIDTPARFEELVRAIGGEPFEYRDFATPRSRVAGNVYTSTDYPADQAIELHNECAYAASWPMVIAFCCITPADRGGETPIADSRRVLAALDPELVAEFERRGVAYVRNFGGPLGLSWQQMFGTSDLAAAAEACVAGGGAFETTTDGRVRTRHVRDAVAVHPRTGERVWFNQATAFHVTSIARDVRDALGSELSDDEAPKNAYFGDGAPIEPAMLDEIRDAYRRETVAFPWRAGDALVLDNMLCAHGRAPYAGERRVCTAMAEPASRPRGGA